MSQDEGPSIPGQENASHFILLAFGFGSYVNKLQDAIDDYGNPFAQYSGWFQNFLILSQNFWPFYMMILKPFVACEYSRRKRFRELPDMVADMIGEALKDC